MKKSFFITVSAIIAATSFNNVFAENALTAKQILKGVDNVINAPRDQTLKQKMILIDRKGNEKVRILRIFQKGFDRRMAKFLSPADQKGIAFLSLPNDVIYLYLPAFKKVRRIAAHVKNTKFAGTDFTYEDMEAKRYADKWIPKLLKTEENIYLLQIIPKSGTKTDYSKMILQVRKDNFYPARVELYNKGGKLFKIATTSNIKKIGKYWVAKETIMKDIKTRHTTKVILLDVKFDRGLSNRKFSKRSRREMISPNLQNSIQKDLWLTEVVKQITSEGIHPRCSSLPNLKKLLFL